MILAEADELAEQLASRWPRSSLAGSYETILAAAPNTFKRPIYAGNATQTVQLGEANKVIAVRTASFRAAPRVARLPSKIVSAAADPAVSTFAENKLL